ncbi:D-glycerate dehydrogenase [Peribacillus simplex]|uniref:2-hydroxyacid dehydrogenase n=1 Tax=Peribacillus simplex TaxID=1478 RepID=UPI0010BF5E36|nr:D-glycerate dehydrogenase [Peribacillus simplex]TKH03451.1 D-glycerate dehydrogenase [Peribacillus simplex]
MSKPKVVITRRIPDTALRMIEVKANVFIWDYEDVPIPRDILLKECREASGIFTNVGDLIDHQLFENSPKLKVVSTMAVGFDNIDIQEATKRGIRVGHTPGILSETTADLTFALLMATARRIVEATDYIKEGKWKSWSPMLLTGQDVYGAVIGIIGMGRIGEGVARRALGFGMKILYHNRNRLPDTEEKLNTSYRSLDDLVKESDYVVMLAPSTPETYKMIGERELALMKPNAIFINASRGTNVDENALYSALKEKRIWAAGLDVFENEPLSSQHPLMSLPNVLATPHIGSATISTRTKMAVLTSQNLLLGLEDKPLIHCVNFNSQDSTTLV